MTPAAGVTQHLARLQTMMASVSQKGQIIQNPYLVNPPARPTAFLFTQTHPSFYLCPQATQDNYLRPPYPTSLCQWSPLKCCTLLCRPLVIIQVLRIYPLIRSITFRSGPFYFPILPKPLTFDSFGCSPPPPSCSGLIFVELPRIWIIHCIATTNTGTLFAHYE